MAYGRAQHKNYGTHEIYNFGRPFLVYHYYILSLSDLYPGVEKRNFYKMKKKEIKKSMILTKHYQPWEGECHESYNSLSPYPTYATYQI